MARRSRDGILRDGRPMNFGTYGVHRETVRDEDKEKQSDCPAIGVGGVHSDKYFEGEECQWCGGKAE